MAASVRSNSKVMQPVISAGVLMSPKQGYFSNLGSRAAFPNMCLVLNRTHKSSTKLKTVFDMFHCLLESVTRRVNNEWMRMLLVHYNGLHVLIKAVQH